jgi:hypothetical protein
LTIEPDTKTLFPLNRVRFRYASKVTVTRWDMFWGVVASKVLLPN